MVDEKYQQNIGLLMTRFPGQTSIAMYRVGTAMQMFGVKVQLLSTTCPPASEHCHQRLRSEVRNTFYCWPPRLSLVFARALKKPRGILRCIAYIVSLKESPWLDRIKMFPMILSGAALAEFCSRRSISHVLVHSCADAAFLINFCNFFDGPPFSLRLGGDLAVYGQDHKAKMRRAFKIFPAAKNNRDEILEKVGIPNDRLITTSLGVDTNRFKPLEVPTRSKRTSLQIVTVARLNYVKGHEYVLRAVAELIGKGVPVNYKIAGSGPNEPKLRELVRDLEIESNVEFLGALDETQVIELLQNSDLFVLASFDIGEAAPVAVLEAMSCGLVCICSEIGGTSDFIQDSHDGFIIPQKEYQPMVKIAMRLWNDIELLESVGIRARMKMQLHFDTLRIAERILSAILEKPGNGNAP